MWALEVACQKIFSSKCTRNIRENFQTGIGVYKAILNGVNNTVKWKWQMEKANGSTLLLGTTHICKGNLYSERE